MVTTMALLQVARDLRDSGQRALSERVIVEACDDGCEYVGRTARYRFGRPILWTQPTEEQLGWFTWYRRAVIYGFFARYPGLKWQEAEPGWRYREDTLLW